MLKGLLSKLRPSRSAGQTFEPVWDTTTPQAHSSLPAEADDVRELHRALTDSIREELAKRNLAASDIELRRRLSRREYCVYISLRSEEDIRTLSLLADELTKLVLEDFHIEIARFFWRYKLPN